MSDPHSETPRRGLLVWTIQTVAVLGLLTFFTTQVFVRLVGEPRGNTQVAAGYKDPETTGSIGGSARETRLDPCAVRGTQTTRR